MSLARPGLASRHNTSTPSICLRRHQPTRSDKTLPILEELCNANESEGTKTKRLLKERKIVMQFIVITGLFVICWTPCILKFILEAFEVLKAKGQNPLWSTLVAIGGNGNSAVNPFVCKSTSSCEPETQPKPNPPPPATNEQTG